MLSFRSNPPCHICKNCKNTVLIHLEGLAVCLTGSQVEAGTGKGAEAEGGGSLREYHGVTGVVSVGL